MQLLTTTNVYDVERDCSNPAFLELVRNPPADAIVLEGNAGLGADWPAGVWKSLNGAAVALAIISAPSTIEENWPRWKSIFNDITQHIIEFHGEYRIDRDSAHVIGIHHAVSQYNLSASKLTIHMAIRHYFASVAGYEDMLKTERTEMDWPESADFGTEPFSQGVRSNEEAARQASCRYIFGIDDGETCLTLVVEQDGSISTTQKLDLKREWG